MLQVICSNLYNTISLRTKTKVAIKRIRNIFDLNIDAKRVYREIYILRYGQSSIYIIHRMLLTFQFFKKRHINHPNIIKLLNVIAPHLHEYKCDTNISEMNPNKLSFILEKRLEACRKDTSKDTSQTPITETYENKNFYSHQYKKIPEKNRFSSKKRGRVEKRDKESDDNNLDDIYLIFEFVDTDLYKLILSPQYISTAHIQTFLHQILLSLKYLQSAHVIHRDLKPANILVNEDCSLKLCDFGLSRVVGLESMTYERTIGIENPKPPPSLTRCLTRHVVTRWYRAPELILLQEYSSAVDMWSLGCVFGELLSMQAESVKDHDDRLPMFPGRSCPSLSGDGLLHKLDGTPLETTTDRLDQLSAIFDVIGSPSDDDIELISDANTKIFLRSLPKKSAKVISSYFD